MVSDMKYALYARKSLESSERQIQSIGDQLDFIRNLAKEEDLNIVKEYIDEKTGTKPGVRQQFNQMVLDIEDGLVDSIICWSVDRIARNHLDLGKIQHYLQTGKIRQIRTQSRIYYPGHDSLYLNFEAGLSVDHSIKLSQNVKRGHSSKLKKGVYPNKAPIGYLNAIGKIKGERDIIPDPKRFSPVRKCWDMLLVDGLSVPKIREKALAMGLRVPARGQSPEKELSLNGLYTIFRNPFYYGEFQWSGGLHKGKHKPMITKQEFNKAQKLIGSRTRPKKKSYKHDYPYRGLILCGECGSTITIAPKPNRHNPEEIRHYYRCSCKDKKKCSQKSLRQEFLEEQIDKIVNSISISPEFAEWTKNWLQYESKEEFEQYEDIKKQQRKRIDKIDQERSELVDMKIQKHIDQDLFAKKQEKLLNEKRVIEKELNLQTMSHEEHIEKTMDIFEFCRDIQDLYENGTIEDKDLVLTTLGSHYVLKDKKLDIVLKPQFELISKANSEKWTLNPRFPTLPTHSEPEFDAETCQLIKNGGGDGVLPPVSNSFQQRCTTSVVTGSAILPFA